MATSDAPLFKDVLTGVDVVVHLAAISNDPMGNTFEAITDHDRASGLARCRACNSSQLPTGISTAPRAYRETGVHDVAVVDTLPELGRAMVQGRVAVTEDALLLSRVPGIDALLEVTSRIEYAAEVVLLAIEQRKHVILMNAELDGTVGPILKV